MATSETTWLDRVLTALGGLPGGTGPDTLAEEVALRFADRFDPADRDYVGLATRPQWQGFVLDAVEELRAASLIEPDRLALTRAGRDALAALAGPSPEPGPRTAAGLRPGGDRPGGDRPGGDLPGAGEAGADQPDADQPDADQPDADQPGVDQPGGNEPGGHGDGIPVVAGVISAPLRDPDARRGFGFSDAEDEPIPVMVELNLRYSSGPAGAVTRLGELWQRATDAAPPRLIAGRYVAGELTMSQMKRLVAADAVPVRWPSRSIHHIWPDFPVRPHIDASCVTIKADAARNSFEADGRGIVWAVIDSGIDADHPHFSAYGTLNDPSVRDLHRYFPPAGDPTPDGALDDQTGHGTHVAGIIAGDIEPWLREKPGQRKVYATESRYNAANPDTPLRMPRDFPDDVRLAGMAPRARLVSLKALGGGGTLTDRVNRVIQALAYVRETNGDGVDGMRIHGVNISLGYEFYPEWFACGGSPLCQEIDRTVRSGVVVVVAAGNSGFGTLNVKMDATDKFGFAMTVNDPGNAQLAITVGSTHRSAPHLYGVSYFSSKGPTGDGREKPDLVAPGERITSCAAGANLVAVVGSGDKPADTAVYVEDSGTSMAAPHVSGAAAALLSVRREFLGQPEKVKHLLRDSATDLGRRREFQGAGLLDLMRALQSV
ncbi:S8 family peptidase [Actinoplanes sp. CA-030573]|uniref:S8 family peptidase n=1 Tax=Actinoplanes sp. CA-030573 TaxID=3239898 RepID=UPI003D8A1D71